jgi:hypothetical protein
VFIVDDILLFPVKSLFWIFREIHNAGLQEMADEADAVTLQLSELYMMLETGKISEAEFDEEERRLLDRLDVVQSRD